MNDGRIAYIDFGMMDQLDRHERNAGGLCI